MRTASTLLACVVLLGAAVGCAKTEAKAEEPAPSSGPPPVKVCMVSASDEYASNDELTEFQKTLERRFNIVCTRAFGKEKDTELEGLEKLDSSDVMIVYTRRSALGTEQLEHVRKFVAAGKGVVGIRTASHAFKGWPEFDKEVLGGNYTGHYGKGPATQLTIVEKAKGHPILAGFTAYESASWLYKNPGVVNGTNNVEVLLTGTTKDKTEPVAWTHERGAQRVFYTSLGTHDDFENAGFRQMLVNAVFWTAKRPIEAKPPEAVKPAPPRRVFDADKAAKPAPDKAAAPAKK